MPDKYEVQHIAVDIAILTSENNSVENMKILLIKRRNPPFKDLWAIPGGHLDEGESLEQAAYRELEEETSLSQQELQHVSLHQYKAYGDPGRDPRYRMVSIVYYAIVPYSEALLAAVVARDDAKEAGWFSIQSPPEVLAFDHGMILRNLLISASSGQFS